MKIEKHSYESYIQSKCAKGQQMLRFRCKNVSHWINNFTKIIIFGFGRLSEGRKPVEIF